MAWQPPPTQYWTYLPVGFLLLVLALVAVLASYREPRPGKSAPASFGPVILQSRASSEDLRSCLAAWRAKGLWLGPERRGSGRRIGWHGTWRRLYSEPDAYRATNSARQLVVDVIDQGADRTIRVFTRSGRPLRNSERKVLEACAGAAG